MEDPRNGQLWAQLGSVLVKQGDAGTARRALARAYRLQPDLLSLWTMPHLDVWRLKDRDRNRFETELETLITIGLALNDDAHFQAAVRIFDRAISLEPSWSFLWTCKGMILTNLGRHEQALPILDHALVLNRGDVGAWTMKVKALAALGRKDEAHVARQHEYAARRATGVPEWMPRDEGGTP